MSIQRKRIVFHQENCISCHGCEVACKSWRGVELGVKWRRIDTIWHGDYPHIKSKPISVTCRHCDDPACLQCCPTGAIEKIAATGIVIVNHDLCSGCQTCAEACSYLIPQFGIDGKMQKCDLCYQAVGDSGIPPCVATCPTQALEYESY
ncbi:4Fe-4S dicluster domain-containing protein [Dehalobacter sp.]|jgi:anaerobic dimethyl sulfoxide reductase subunit B (iron-sulfur subunit)|uniref:4Fe-4S dicluster domain-containing protein n=1 Tax=Dehalobacter sp. TaxID=1962289 RepID=UPI002582B7E5|nr:4Fe-4S dicluster domain-containing protein [Dehalobacter sp.]MCG1025400.1 4Fe-4S ferredoxin [Dehalobacter sp.]